MRVSHTILLLAIVLACSFAPDVQGQMERGDRNLGPAPGGKSVIYGDLTVKGDTATGSKANSYEINLYARGSFGSVVARQTIPANGRYRFSNLIDGDYDIAVVVENNEVTRIKVMVRAPIYPTDIRQDITLEWKAINNRPAKPASVTAEDSYTRTAPNQKIFDKAQAGNRQQKIRRVDCLSETTGGQRSERLSGMDGTGHSFPARKESA